MNEICLKHNQDSRKCEECLPFVEKERTLQQNKALHLWFQLLADELNDAGLDLRAVLKPNVEIPWRKETIKDFLWRPVQETYLKKKSTKELSTKDIDEIWEILNRHLGEKFGIHIPFPSIELLSFYEENHRRT